MSHQQDDDDDNNEWGLTQSSKFYADHKLQWGPGRRTVMLAFDNGAQLTDFDITAMHNMKPQTVRPRRIELWRLGFVMPVGMKKKGRQRVQVWAASPAGEAQIEVLKANTL